LEALSLHRDIPRKAEHPQKRLNDPGTDSRVFVAQCPQIPARGTPPTAYELRVIEEEAPVAAHHVPAISKNLRDEIVEFLLQAAIPQLGV